MVRSGAEEADWMSHSLRVLSVDAVASWEAPMKRTYDTARLWPAMTAKGLAICNPGSGRSQLQVKKHWSSTLAL